MPLSSVLMSTVFVAAVFVVVRHVNNERVGERALNGPAAAAKNATAK